MEETKAPETANEQISPKRPFFLSIVCIVSFVYNALVIALFVASFFFKDYFIQLSNEYTSAANPVLRYFLVVISGIILFSLSFYGVWKIWMMKKPGFIVYLTSNLIIMILLFFFFSLSLWYFISSMIIILIYWIFLKKME